MPRRYTPTGPRRCQYCGFPLLRRRRHTRFCNGACRIADWRIRQAVKHKLARAAEGQPICNEFSPDPGRKRYAPPTHTKERSACSS